MPVAHRQPGAESTRQMLLAPMLHPTYAVPLAALLGVTAPVLAQDAVMTVHHVPVAGGGPDGTPDLPMAGRVAVWAHRAGLALRWEAVPFKRSLQDLQRNQQPMCVLGVFDTPERRRYARFSLPIYQEEQQVFLAAKRVAATLRAQRDARTAVLSPTLQLLVYDGVSYAGTLDGWIAQRQPPPVRASAGTSGLATMLVRGNADFTISVASELREMKQRRVPHAQGLEAVLLPGMPPPPLRHLACSMQVSPAWMQRFDAAVRAQPQP